MYKLFFNYLQYNFRHHEKNNKYNCNLKIINLKTNLIDK